MVMADTVLIEVQSLRPGDKVDLEADTFADRNHDHLAYEFEFSVVNRLVVENPNCICVYFEEGNPVGFPPTHLLPLQVR
jgi:hypothetical protein